MTYGRSMLRPYTKSLLRPYPISCYRTHVVVYGRSMLRPPTTTRRYALQKRRGAACCAPTSKPVSIPALGNDLGRFFRRPLLRPPFLAQMRHRGPDGVRDLALLPQRRDHRLRLLRMELERARLGDGLIE